MEHQGKKIAILGGGSWATAMAKILLENVETINWFIRSEENIELFKKYQHNPGYLRGVHFNTDRITFFSKVADAVRLSDIIILAIPSAFLNDALQELSPEEFKGKLIVSSIKGIVPKKRMLVSDYLKHAFEVESDNVIVVGGPCHAEEIALEKLSYLTVVCTNENIARTIESILICQYVRTSIMNDVVGTELMAVLKNIISIASGIINGLRYGDNFQAVLVSNALLEIERFMNAVYPMNRTVGKSVYLGDLLVSAYSQFSRNRIFGTMIGKGYSIRSAQIEMDMVAEGYYAVNSVSLMNEKYNVDMPIVNCVYNILYKGRRPSVEIDKLIEKLQ
ncbi:MAG: NAD(P)H-dependent glycerol-3-phosphate dehydrogenase [Bacteroidales bacterium]